MELSCPLGTTRRVPLEKFARKPHNKSFIDQVCSVKMAGYWPRSFFCEFMDLDSVSVHKHGKKNKVLVIRGRKIRDVLESWLEIFQKKVTDFPIAKHFDAAQHSLRSKYWYYLYYMASSVSGESDESNPSLWLATRAGKMELSCPLGTTRRVPLEKFARKPHNKSFIDQTCSVKMAGYWPRSFFASLWTSTPSRSINTQRKNLANIQPSPPHTWSITHTYRPCS